MSITPESLVDGIDRLVSLPEVSVRINHLLTQGDYTSSSLAELIAHDADMSARLLRLVNSAFYGLPTKIDTIQRAVTLAGANEVRNLVMAVSVMQRFTGIPAEFVDMTRFWRQAVTTGVLAQAISRQCDTLRSDRLFVAGMLHDLGRLVIYLSLPEQAREVLYITGGDEWILADTEREVLGFSHTDVGAALFQAWGLPEGLQAVALHHHHPQSAKAYAHDVAIVHIALAIAHAHLDGCELDQMPQSIEPAVWATTGLSYEALVPHLPEMLEKAGEAVGLFTSPGERQSA